MTWDPTWTHPTLFLLFLWHSSSYVFCLLRLCKTDKTQKINSLREVPFRVFVQAAWHFFLFFNLEFLHFFFFFLVGWSVCIALWGAKRSVNSDSQFHLCLSLQLYFLRMDFPICSFYRYKFSLPHNKSWVLQGFSWKICEANVKRALYLPLLKLLFF